MILREKIAMIHLWHISKNKLFLTVLLVMLIALPTSVVVDNNSDTELDVTHDMDDLTLDQIVFVVLTQPNSYHLKRALVFRSHFESQIKYINPPPELYLTHETWPYIGSWTLFPMMKDIAERFHNKSWLFVCEDETRLNLQLLLKILSQYDAKKDMYLGHALTDFKALYKVPDLGGGIALSNPVFTQLGERFKNGWTTEDHEKLQFWSLHPERELSRFLFMTNRLVLTDVPELCTSTTSDGCAAWYPTMFPDCGEDIPTDHLFVAVKTCEKYHKDRIAIVKATWGNTTSHIEYYSHVEDPSIPAIDIGTENTEIGHCAKSMAILKRFHSHPKLTKYPWLLLADDDTIINLKRLRKLLACYDSTEPVHLGERFGYRVQRDETDGYNYITGGGGMVFSRAVINLMAEKNAFKCLHNTQPDDMEIGKELNKIHVVLTHSPYFHQYRMGEYSQELLRPRLSLSFHKHTKCDPIETYNYLLKEPDLNGQKSQTQHEEL